MFHFNNKRSTFRVIHSVQKTMMSDFIRKYLGFLHINRKAVIDHPVISIAVDLFLNSSKQVAVVMDTTSLGIFVRAKVY